MRREERGERREERGETRAGKRERGKERGERREERGEEREEEKEQKGMTPDLSLLSDFARGVLLSLHVRDTCLHLRSWLLSVFFCLRRAPHQSIPSVRPGGARSRNGLGFRV